MLGGKRETLRKGKNSGSGISSLQRGHPNDVVDKGAAIDVGEGVSPEESGADTVRRKRMLSGNSTF